MDSPYHNRQLYVRTPPNSGGQPGPPGPEGPEGPEGPPGQDATYENATMGGDVNNTDDIVMIDGVPSLITSFEYGLANLNSADANTGIFTITNSGLYEVSMDFVLHQVSNDKDLDIILGFYDGSSTYIGQGSTYVASNKQTFIQLNARYMTNVEVADLPFTIQPFLQSIGSNITIWSNRSNIKVERLYPPLSEV